MCIFCVPVRGAFEYVVKDATMQMMQHYLQLLGEVDLRCFIVPSLLKRGWTRNLRRHLSENSLFCSDDSDDNGTFRSQVQMHGMGKPILVCEWPEKDAQLVPCTTEKAQVSPH